MEKQTRTPQLVDDWEVRSMEEEDCRCGCKGGAEAGVHLQASLAQFDRRGTSRRRTAVAVVALLLLGVLAALITVGLRKPWHVSPENSQLNRMDVQPSDDGKHQVTPAYQELKKHPRARLTVLRKSNDSETHLQWESNGGRAYCNGGFLYTDGDLVVPRTGFYRVYVQITYESVDKTCPLDVMVLTHSVLHYEDRYPEYLPLLKAVDTVRCDKPWQKSLYSCAVFHLNANDRLRVKTSQPRNIMKNEYEAFFGAELLPD